MSENRKLRRLKQKLRREERNAIQDPGPATPAGVSPFQAVQMQIRMGPLPTAEELAHYDAVLPGTAERLVRQMERMTDLAAEQQKHRFGLEKDVINGNIQSQQEGTRFGGVIALATILGGIALIWNDKPTGGYVAIIGALTALVSVFVIGRRKQVRELAEKRAAEIVEQIQEHARHGNRASPLDRK